MNIPMNYVNYQCLNALNKLNNNTKRQRFTPEEDQLIKTLADDKKLSWDEISKRLPGRTGRQCKDRYNNYLNKVVVHKEWTKEEDKIILEKYQELGPRWTAISNYLEGRSGNNVKNRWYKYILKHFSSENIQTSATFPRKRKNQTETSQTSSENETVDDPFLQGINPDIDFDFFYMEQDFENCSLF